MELFLLLPRRQAAALEALAHHQGITMGRLLRQLIGGLVERNAAPRNDDPVFRARGIA